MNKRILVTGGAGFIGSHTVCQLIGEGYEVVVIDNLSNSSPESIKRLNDLTQKNIELIVGDLCEEEFVNTALTDKGFSSVIHFAGLKSVKESINSPLKYYQNNFLASLNLIKAMQKNNIQNIIFSSSATVYGNNINVPYKEDFSFGTPSSPYGSTKILIEQMLRDICLNYDNLNGISLRYFNPIGAHESGKIGENPNDIPNNLMPYITQVAVGKLEKLTIFGNDYDTKDGTCLRDYFHVMDLADGHLAALKKLESNTHTNFYETYNLGSGKPRSVLEIVDTFSEINKVEIPYVIGPRREGDLPKIWADGTKANKELGWKAKKTLKQMVKDSWNWQVKNPRGYF